MPPRYWPVVVVALLALLLGRSAQAEANLLQNSGFEAGFPPWQQARGSWNLVNPGKTGNNAAQAGGMVQAKLQQSLTPVGGAVYRFEGWARKNDASRVELAVVFMDCDLAMLNSFQATLDAVSGDYIFLTRDALANDRSCRARVEASLAGLSDTSRAWFDDITLAVVSLPPPTATPTVIPTATVPPSPTPTPTSSPTATATPVATVTSTRTVTPTRTATPSRTPTPTRTGTASATPTATGTPAATRVSSTATLTTTPIVGGTTPEVRVATASLTPVNEITTEVLSGFGPITLNPSPVPQAVERETGGVPGVALSVGLILAAGLLGYVGWRLRR